ncbi:flavin-containing monooxygenase [Trujillonella endophytica]|uniref:Predicted flavoprotein CzcO associated with the cation diffusion facilitator CzcD n=1 Tax=Trujillonella endophytica TaxID=673521 RepID=A0A1H8PR99_9ACTN|nr:NAD(P)/FAD-dependent oxidoreductase [Trujillella endophytica]SEO44542.1 Predicted flavoprotein CzcO associated with the cation diffusion facilitator CzcD [Trujillella endophytica]
MTAEHVDVLIVGAGLSGIGAACHLERERPGTTYAVLEARAAMGGTWDLFRYPGVRSDSDMFTLGYAFRPWTDPQAIADGTSIRDYIEETAREYGVDRRIRYRSRVLSAQWSSADARWTVTVERTDTGEQEELTCSWLSVCSGYYRYDEGFTPRFEGAESFRGQVVHPQHWPEDLDVTGKRVVVIGSGATAVTLVPSLAPQAAHVTMLQRTPTYVVALPGRDALAEKLRRRLPERVVYPVVRWKSVLVSMASYQLSRRRPALMKKVLRKAQERQLPAGFDLDTHFSPPYDPWDQRLCVVPDGDLFRALRSGSASIVTDRIARFDETGIRLASGEHLAADVIVTATGLNLLPIGGMALTVDGRPVELSETVSYKGMMVSGVPNFTLTIGYTNASWTLKADLVARHVCRLLEHLERTGTDIATPLAPAGPEREPFLGLSSGYVQRSLDRLPKQGGRAPWKLHQNYILDLRLFRRGPVEDEGIRFSRRQPARLPAAA